MIDNYPKPLPLTAEEKAMIEKVSQTRSEALAKKAIQCPALDQRFAVGTGELTARIAADC